MRRELTPLSQLLPPVLAGLAKETGDARPLRLLWKEAVGPIIARHSCPVSLSQGVLVIRVESVRWRLELEGHERELRCRLADHLGGVKLNQLQFRLNA